LKRSLKLIFMKFSYKKWNIFYNSYFAMDKIHTTPYLDVVATHNTIFGCGC
jgi:hypothetical protein